MTNINDIPYKCTNAPCRSILNTHPASNRVIDRSRLVLPTDSKGKVVVTRAHARQVHMRRGSATNFNLLHSPSMWKFTTKRK